MAGRKALIVCRPQKENPIVVGSSVVVEQSPLRSARAACRAGALASKVGWGMARTPHRFRLGVNAGRNPRFFVGMWVSADG
jgi:hypothetical protein